MKVAHICSYFSITNLYENLFYGLDSNLEQTIYVPIRVNSPRLINNMYNLSLKKGTIIPLPIWKTVHRLAYRNKIKRGVRSLLSRKFDFDILHAHTWFSDGGIAYELFKKTGTPYIINIRNTDLNYFFKYRVDLRSFGLNILKNASRIVFVSHAYLELFKKVIPESLFIQIEFKTIVIPNGIDDFWFKNELTISEVSNFKEGSNAIYAGKIDKNKNIGTLIQAYLSMDKKLRPSKLLVIGFGSESSYEKRIIKEYGQYSNIELIKKMNMFDLKKMFEKALYFVMVSKFETFGLVYVESISQGIPIVYSENQGIDGFFKEGLVGEAVNPYRISSVKNGMERVVKNISKYRNGCEGLAKEFQWKFICQKYVEVYNETVIGSY